MPFWYFLPIPKLTSDLADQSNQVQLLKYLLHEGDTVSPGTPIALVETHWAVMKLKANGDGYCEKLFFKPGTYVKIGDPIAIIAADGENIPYDREYVVWELVQLKAQKPPKRTKPKEP